MSNTVNMILKCVILRSLSMCLLSEVCRQCIAACWQCIRIFIFN